MRCREGIRASTTLRRRPLLCTALFVYVLPNHRFLPLLKMCDFHLSVPRSQRCLALYFCTRHQIKGKEVNFKMNKALFSFKALLFLYFHLKGTKIFFLLFGTFWKSKGLNKKSALFILKFTSLPLIWCRVQKYRARHRWDLGTERFLCFS